jgi:hypothetical protein
MKTKEGNSKADVTRTDPFKTSCSGEQATNIPLKYIAAPLTLLIIG